MKSLIMTGICFNIILISCSKNDNVQNSAPADYATTKQTMIKARAGGSDTANTDVIKDTLPVPTAMPPQSKDPDKKQGY